MITYHHDDYDDHHDFIIKTAWQVFSMMTVLISKNTILQRLHIKIIYDMTRQNRWPPLAWTRNLLHNWQSDERALIGWRLPVGRAPICQSWHYPYLSNLNQNFLSDKDERWASPSFLYFIVFVFIEQCNLNIYLNINNIRYVRILHVLLKIWVLLFNSVSKNFKLSAEKTLAVGLKWPLPYLSSQHF